MNEPLPLPETATLEEVPAVPHYWDYVAGSYAMVGLVMAWLVLTTYRKRLSLRREQSGR